MKLIVGLGNPGVEYGKTRHNIGWLTIDMFVDDLCSRAVFKEKFNGSYLKTKIKDVDVILLKPLTFMNNSGEAVQKIAHFFKVDVKDIIVVYDDMALPPGSIRLRASGSSGSHKGMQSIIDHLGTTNIQRIRVGIGEPKNNVIDYVLGVPKGEEAALIYGAVSKAVDALVFLIADGNFEVGMSKFN